MSTNAIWYVRRLLKLKKQILNIRNMFLKKKEFELSPDAVIINRKLTLSTDEQLVQMYNKYSGSENHYKKMIIVRHLLEDRNYKI
ncbi:hypothetical protein AB4G91_10500 [Macrococcoides goetzii]|uniref:hypothetical protein n=1 Tax=Macrococcus sp. PK TaxID=2801919 RepID=UPI001F0E0AF5|nr:hypothetical protein [Macrococcus sp. PK]MCH4985780.1 hypothetical protein [Macrococcus sp. PK]